MEAPLFSISPSSMKSASLLAVAITAKAVYGSTVPAELFNSAVYEKLAATASASPTVSIAIPCAKQSLKPFPVALARIHECDRMDVFQRDGVDLRVPPRGTAPREPAAHTPLPCDDSVKLERIDHRLASIGARVERRPLRPGLRAHKHSWRALPHS